METERPVQQLEPDGPPSSRGQTVRAWLQAAGVAVTAIMAALTYFTLNELKRANDLVLTGQVQSMRPYLTLQGVGTVFNDPATPEERWAVLVNVVNQSDYPARNVYGTAEINTKPGNTELQRDSALRDPSDLPPRGSVLTIPVTISKQEIKGLHQEQRKVFLHVNVWYDSPNQTHHQLRAVCELAYQEGVAAAWPTVSLLAD